MRRLHAHRNLCEDFEIRILDPQPVAVYARVEIGQVEDAEDLLVTIYQRIAEHISRHPVYTLVSSTAGTGRRNFDGPG
jgi:hypothetical protein